MEIINISNYKETRFQTGVALGNFDGIHLGHQKLINKIIEDSKESGLKSSILLFEDHTKLTINHKQPRLITTYEKKLEIIERLGVDIVYVMNFDEKIMSLSAEEFIKKIIVDKINSKLMVVGFDYRFGYKASGNSSVLLELGRKYNIDVRILKPIYEDEKIISSTEIRKLIYNGDVFKAKNLLGRPYSIIGKVIEGSNRGHKLGFPTANMEINSNLIIPKSGVYKTNSIINDKVYRSLTNIGYNPTFDEKKLKMETHILNFDKNIYGKEIEIVFLDFIRDDIKFDSKEALIEQLNKDVEAIKDKY